MSYILTVEFDADSVEVAWDLDSVIGSIAPFIVDNVNVSLKENR